MDFKHFKTFILAAEELHIGRAAERLGIAQPAVTQQIKVLEASLGYKVFHRVRRGIELTDAEIEAGPFVWRNIDRWMPRSEMIVAWIEREPRCPAFRGTGKAGVRSLGVE